MSLRFFADHGVSNFIIQTLRDEHYEVFRLRDYIPTDSADSVVILKAQEFDSILLSLNKVSLPFKLEIIRKLFHRLWEG